MPTSPPAAPAKTTRPVWPKGSIAPIGCESCRDQHLKCDRVVPVCGRCASTNKECTRGYKFRVKNGPFSKQQRWLRTPRRLRFVDETSVASGEIDELPAVEDDDLLQDEWADSSHSDDTATLHTVTAANDPPPIHSYPTPPDIPAAGAVAGLVRPLSPTDRFIPHEDHQQQHISPVRSLPPLHALTMADALPPPPLPLAYPLDVPPPPPPPPDDPEVQAMRAKIYSEHDVWPLESREEAMLFRHYIEKLSIWLDVCDMCQSFETVVPPRAGRCRILLNAIFALSAKHLAHTTPDYDPYASDRYHQECLNVLIPMLQHEHHTMSDENLFAATIILRMWEEMEVKASGVDAHGYLLGIQAFVHHSTAADGGDDINRRYLMPGSLSCAAFWVGLRQEIYSAVMNQQPVRINLVHSLVDRSLLPTDDFGWANRAVVHCADVLNFCFGAGSQGTFGRSGGLEWWRELTEYNQRWTESLPSSFTPIFLRQPDREKGEVFPEIWYQSACHALGVQHHLLAELFLVSFDPKIPRMGAQRKEAAKRINPCDEVNVSRLTNDWFPRNPQERIQEVVRKVCGIGLCNQWTPPSMFTACMAIAAFGDQFHDRRDQEACLDILKRTEKDHARPTEAVQKQMAKAWETADKT